MRTEDKLVSAQSTTISPTEARLAANVPQISKAEVHWSHDNFGLITLSVKSRLISPDKTTLALRATNRL
jgi:hypothetical protein